MDGIRFNCERCGVGVKAPTDRAGATLPCPKCGTALQVPNRQIPTTDSASPPDEATQFANIAAAAKANPAQPPVPPAPEASAPPAQPIIAPPISGAAPAAQSSVSDANAPYSPPQTEATVSTERVSNSGVRIVDIQVPFSSVFKFAFQLWISMFLIGAVVWMIIMAITLLLGVGLAGLGM